MTATLSASRVREVVGRFAGRRVLIVGDVMLDHFLVGRVNRISPEAPVPVIEFDHESFRLGGAANVAHNVRAFGASVDLVGVVGADRPADALRAELTHLGIETDGLVAASDRPTTKKMRIVTTRNQQVARVDFESDADVGDLVSATLAERALERLERAEVILVSDYLKGVVTARLMSELTTAASASRLPVLVDPKIPHLLHYRGATLVTPNHHEAETATAMRIRNDEDARRAAHEFQRRAGCESVLITRGEHGMWLLERRDGAVACEAALPARAREVSDVTGAGDTVIATMALGLAAGASMAEAAEIANYAAGVSVAKFGPATVSADELLGVVTA
jgi:D-beta-D-heptose 7-phosphate kinase/D-beta-D-heptose 1-phosphate adenosyltransferase